MTSWIVAYLILCVGFYNIYLSFLHTKNLKSSFSAFSSFSQKLTFQCLKDSFTFHYLFMLFYFSAF
jgi:hypothetical protein